MIPRICLWSFGKNLVEIRIMGKVPTSTLKEKLKKKYEDRKNIIIMREKLYE